MSQTAPDIDGVTISDGLGAEGAEETRVTPTVLSAAWIGQRVSGTDPVTLEAQLFPLDGAGAFGCLDQSASTGSTAFGTANDMNHHKSSDGQAVSPKHAPEQPNA